MLVSSANSKFCACYTTYLRLISTDVTSWTSFMPWVPWLQKGGKKQMMEDGRRIFPLLFLRLDYQLFSQVMSRTNLLLHPVLGLAPQM
mmetsp:Transcript_9183/g.12823  ORF Transcript_9183/g.12823 Transcript_9183/m.12823 type:complete len:88 (+) Transcript_9183:135-398(+)